LLADIEKKQKKHLGGVPFSADQAQAYVKELKLKSGEKSAVLPALVEVALLKRLTVGNNWSGRASTYLTTSEGWTKHAKPLPKTEKRKSKAARQFQDNDIICQHLQWSFERITHQTPEDLTGNNFKKLRKVLNGQERPIARLRNKRYYWHPFIVKKEARRGYLFDLDGTNELGVELDIKTALPAMLPAIIRERKRDTNELTIELARLIGILEQGDIYAEFAPDGTPRDSAKKAFNAILNGGDAPGLYAQTRKTFRMRFPLVWGRLQRLINNKNFGSHAMRHLANALRPIFKELHDKNIPALLYSDCLHVPASKADEVEELMRKHLLAYSGVMMRIEHKNKAPEDQPEDVEPAPPDIIDPWHPWVPLTFSSAEELWQERFSNEGRDFNTLAHTFAVFLNESDRNKIPKTKRQLESFMCQHLPFNELCAAA
jgi:hypothetical protein